VDCYIWYSEERPGRAGALPSPLLAVPNVTAHPSMASVPITVLLSDGPLLCVINAAIKGLTTLASANNHERCISVTRTKKHHNYKQFYSSKCPLLDTAFLIGYCRKLPHINNCTLCQDDKMMTTMTIKAHYFN